MRGANQDSWDRKKFKNLKKIPYADEFDPSEVRTLKRGLVPKAKEDKWFIYFKKHTMFFHRRRTGQGAYQVRLKLRRDGSAKVKWAKASKDVIVIDKHYEAALLDFLIANLLLELDIDFPRHVKIEEPAKGVFQKTVAGTENKETIVSKRDLRGAFK